MGWCCIILAYWRGPSAVSDARGIRPMESARMGLTGEPTRRASGIGSGMYAVGGCWGR